MDSTDVPRTFSFAQYITMDTLLVDKTNSNLMKFRAATDGSRTAVPQIAAGN